MKHATPGSRPARTVQARWLLVGLAIAVPLLGALLPPETAHQASPIRVSVSGTLDVAIADEFASGTAETSYALRVGEHSHVPLDLSNEDATEIEAGSIVHVTGNYDRGVIEVDRLDVRTRQSEGGGVAGYLPNEQKVLVILVNFTNDTSEPWTVEEVRERIFTDADSVNEYYQEESGGTVELTGQLNADGDIAGWYTIPSDSSASCDWLTWGGQATSAAIADGVDLSGYDNYMYIWPNTSACEFAGLAFVAGYHSYINGYLSTYVIGHELGHNFSARHASGYRCVDASMTPVPISDDCTLDEYGDPFDIMGGGNRHHHNWHKGQLDFLPAASTVTVTSGSSTHTLAPSEEYLAGETQLLRVPRTYDGPDVLDYYYLEFRQPFGTYWDNFGPADPVVTGVTIRIAEDYNALERSLLIDTEPATTTLLDAPLQVGETFSDVSTGIHITTLDVTASGADVEIVFDTVDSDGDGLFDLHEGLIGTDPEDPDTDGDACLDGAETVTTPGSGPYGGLRDPLHYWDFFDVWTRPLGDPTGWEQDGIITVSDILAVAIRFGSGTPPATKEEALTLAQTPPGPNDAMGYHPAYDRGTLIGSNQWNRGQPDGFITTTDDVLPIAFQFGHRCP